MDEHLLDERGPHQLALGIDREDLLTGRHLVDALAGAASERHARVAAHAAAVVDLQPVVGLAALSIHLDSHADHSLAAKLRDPDLNRTVAPSGDVGRRRGAEEDLRAALGRPEAGAGERKRRAHVDRVRSCVGDGRAGAAATAAGVRNAGLWGVHEALGGEDVPASARDSLQVHAVAGDGDGDVSGRGVVDHLRAVAVVVGSVPRALNAGARGLPGATGQRGVADEDLRPRQAHAAAAHRVRHQFPRDGGAREGQVEVRRPAVRLGGARIGDGLRRATARRSADQRASPTRWLGRGDVARGHRIAAVGLELRHRAAHRRGRTALPRELLAQVLLGSVTGVLEEAVEEVVAGHHGCTGTKRDAQQGDTSVHGGPLVLRVQLRPRMSVRLEPRKDSATHGLSRASSSPAAGRRARRSPPPRAAVTMSRGALATDTHVA